MVGISCSCPILEALNAGALDVGCTGDLSFLTVYATGTPIKAIGGKRSDARTQAMAPADGLAVIYVVPHFAARETHQRQPDQPGRSDDVRSSG